MFLEHLQMLFNVLERAAFMLSALFLLTQARVFKDIMHKDESERKPTELIFVSLLFIFFAIFSTYTGVNVEGSLVNVRIISIISGGIIFGPWVGLPAGIISGIHRFLIDIDGPTSIPCLITSTFAGVCGTLIYHFGNKKHYICWGIAAGMFCEVLTMALIYLLADDKNLAASIVQNIGLPMVLGSASIGLIIKRIQDVHNERDRFAAQQAKRSLDIANQTLPLFKKNHSDSLAQICDIIRRETQADAVFITDREFISAYANGVTLGHYNDHQTACGPLVKKVLAQKTSVVANNYEYEDYRSALIIPLQEGDHITGTLKICFRKKNQISQPLIEMAQGLSVLISTQIEASSAEQTRTMLQKAEFSALQSKINPHFLFNALNAISTLIRIQPDKARSLIANLADFLRYNLERDEDFIDVHSELQQVRDYTAIELARFGNKLTVDFDIDPVHIQIPCLLIQPLVENAIQHGIQPFSRPGHVFIKVKQQSDHVLISVKDTGAGIPQTVIDKLHSGAMEKNKIGLINVHQRVKLIYGQGLQIHNLKDGVEVSFKVMDRQTEAVYVESDNC
ncbi:LytS/YhcK type 5TM receptor domain-containing protein [Photobacterium sanguinicancri]|uniref:LytS/YhcK type 5TM receptor domain-containing protein n=1 Tax=Photobacterium sanguinicancri TaxID=875932 RepID=UPI00349F5CFB